eukprot:484909-Amphidinium_carterae.1
MTTLRQDVNAVATKLQRVDEQWPLLRDFPTQVQHRLDLVQSNHDSLATDLARVGSELAAIRETQITSVTADIARMSSELLGGREAQATKMHSSVPVEGPSATAIDHVARQLAHELGCQMQNLNSTLASVVQVQQGHQPQEVPAKENLGEANKPLEPAFPWKGDSVGERRSMGTGPLSQAAADA